MKDESVVPSKPVAMVSKSIMFQLSPDMKSMFMLVHEVLVVGVHCSVTVEPTLDVGGVKGTTWA